MEGEGFCAKRVKGILLFKPGLRLIPWAVCLGTAGLDPTLRGVKKGSSCQKEEGNLQKVLNAP